MTIRDRQCGYLLVSMIITLFMIASIVVLLTHRSSMSANTASRELETARAEYVAQAGMQHALWRTQNNACMGDVTIPSTNLGADSYTATITGAAAGTSFVLSADQDAWIRSDDVDRNNGTGGSNNVKFETGNVEQVLTRFDISSLPTNAPVNSAIAWFHLRATKNHPEGRITIHEITADWDETGVTWDSFDAAYRAGAVAAIPAQDAGDTWVAVNITGLVQSWVNGQPNNGILLDSTAEGLHTEYTAREDGTSPPRLEVTIGSGPASAVQIQSEGTLDTGTKRTRQKTPVPAYQPATKFEVSPSDGSGQDTMMKQDAQTNNLGASDNLWVQDTSGGNGDHSLLQFDLSGLPLGAHIVSASLSLHQHYASTPGGTVSAHRISREWDEGSEDNFPGEGVTWVTYDWFAFWSDPGGDYDPQPAAVTDIANASVGRVEWDVTSLVAGWVRGDYPNHGLMLVSAASGTDVGFKSSDDADTSLHPRLTVSYSCECGTACLSPSGAGRIALIGDDWTPDPDDQLKIEIIKSWGYDVDFYQDRDSAGINWSNYDLAYVSETSIAGDVHANLASLSIGVINEEPNLYDNLDLASGDTEHVGSSVDVTDNSHFITSVFPQGSLPIYTGGMEILTANTPHANGLQTLAEFGGASTLTATDQGAQTIGGTAAGRRVTLPFGQHSAAGFDWKNLNQNGHLLVQRAIAWGIGDDIAAAGDLLMVVGNDGGLTSQESAKKSLLESWGWTVSVIDEDDNQGEFDAALAANDVVFVTEDANSSDIGDKLTAAEIGVVIEEVNLASALGLGASIDWGSGTELVVDAGHYITATLTPGIVEVLNTTESLATLSGALSSELDAPGRFGAKNAVSALDAGRYRFDGGGATGRRVMLPWGGNNMDVDYLTDDGLTIFQRAIEWGAGACASTRNLLLVVGDETNPEARDTGRKSLFRDWCYTVTLIDDGASQAELDAAAISTDVIYVGGTTDAATLSDKLANVAKPLLNEPKWLVQDFGFSEDEGYNATFTGFLESDGSHYITAPFGGGAITIFTEAILMGNLHGTMSADLQVLGGFAATPILGALESGARRWDGATAPARRVQLPFEHAEISQLTGDGLAILRRTLDWATGYEHGLIAHWKLDEGTGLIAEDSVGGHHGSLLNGPVWGDGIFDGSVHFSDESHAVTVPHSASLTITGDLTLLAWVNMDELLPNRPIVQKGSDNIDHNYFFGLYNDNMQFAVSPPGGGWHVKGSGATGIQPGSWHHLAVSFNDLTNEVAFFLDGALFATNELTHTPSEFAGPVHIGRNRFNYGIKGRVDDVRIYRRTLAAGEIAEIFEAAKPAEAHWKLDETSGSIAEDTVGGHDGTTSNTEWVAGKVGGALRFNSSSDSVLVPHSDEMSFTNDLTVAAWINKTNFFGYDGAVVKATTGSDVNYFLGTWESNPVFGFSTSSDNWQGFYATSVTLQPNTWYHLAATFDNAADRVRIYLDGSLAQEFVAPQEPVTNTGNIMLGRSAIGEYWPGLLDEVRILDRALDASDVSDLAVGGGSPPIAHWMLDDGTGSIAVDSEGGHDGTLANGPTWVAGHLGDALRFDGSNDRVNVPHQPGLNMVATMTLSAWVNPDTLKPFQMILTKGDNGVYENYWIGMEGNKANFGFVAGGSYYQHTTSGLTLSTGQWHHIAATYDDAANEVKIYVDGVAETFSTPGTPVVNGEKLIIGNSYYGGEGFDGIIDDVRIYNGVLSSTQISEIAAESGSGGSGGGAAPVFEEFTEGRRVVSTSSALSMTIPKPAGTSAGDLLVVAAATDGNTGSTLRPDPDWEWNLTELDVGDGSGAVTFGVWWKIADGTESSSLRIEWSNPEEAYGWMMRFTGHDPISPIGPHLTTTGNSRDPYSPLIDTTSENNLILRLAAFDDDDITVDVPGLPGHTVITMDRSNTGNRNTVSGGAGYVIQPDAGDTGGVYYSLSAREQYRSITIAIQPAP